MYIITQNTFRKITDLINRDFNFISNVSTFKSRILILERILERTISILSESDEIKNVFEVKSINSFEELPPHNERKANTIYFFIDSISNFVSASSNYINCLFFTGELEDKLLIWDSKYNFVLITDTLITLNRRIITRREYKSMQRHIIFEEGENINLEKFDILVSAPFFSLLAFLKGDVKSLLISTKFMEKHFSFSKCIKTLGREEYKKIIKDIYIV